MTGNRAQERSALRPRSDRLQPELNRRAQPNISVTCSRAGTACTNRQQLMCQSSRSLSGVGYDGRRGAENVPLRRLSQNRSSVDKPKNDRVDLTSTLSFHGLSTHEQHRAVRAASADRAVTSEADRDCWSCKTFVCLAQARRT